MASLVDISMATESDIPDIARICLSAYKSDLMSRILYTLTLDNGKAERDLSDAYCKEIHSPNARIAKATLKGTDTIVGYIYAYRVGADGSVLESGLSTPAYTALGSLMGTLLRKKQDSLLSGTAHWVGKHLMVLPEYQRQGIGRALVKYALEELDYNAEPIYLGGTMSGTGLYQKMGWKKLDVVTVGDATAHDPGREGYMMNCMVGSFPPAVPKAA